MDGYLYTFGGGANGGTYLSGAYAFPDFNAQIVYVTLKYNLK